MAFSFVKFSNFIPRMLLVIVFACDQPRTSSTVYTTQSASVQQAYLSISGSQNLKNIGICAISDATVCSDSHAVFVKATDRRLSGAKAIFSFALPVSVPDSTLVFNIYDVDNKKIIRKFRATEVVVGSATLQSAIESISAPSLRKDLEYFASDELRGRLTGSQDMVKASEFITARLQELQISPARGDHYRQTFVADFTPQGLGGASLSNDDVRNTFNVVSIIPGQDPNLKDQFIVIGAHMDHAGTLEKGFTCSRGTRNVNVCAGADDNGSGAMAVLSVAKALSQVRNQLKRSVVIIWYSGEEEGLLGSNFYVNQDPIFPLEKTAYQINLDMVGYMSSNKNKALLALGGGTYPKAVTLLKAMGAKYPNNPIRISKEAGGGSDHVPYMDKGIPGVFIHTGVENNKNYHKTSDTPDKIDYQGMEMAARVSFELLYILASDADAFPAKLNLVSERTSLITPEEKLQSCHHLMDLSPSRFHFLN